MICAAVPDKPQSGGALQQIGHKAWVATAFDRCGE